MPPEPDARIMYVPDKPNTAVRLFLQGKQVKQVDVRECLHDVSRYHMNDSKLEMCAGKWPNAWSEDAKFPDRDKAGGLFLYFDNRLIEPGRQIPLSTKAPKSLNGYIFVTDVTDVTNGPQPQFQMHNAKQKFLSLGHEIKGDLDHLISEISGDPTLRSAAPNVQWVECILCKKWRKVSQKIDSGRKWMCDQDGEYVDFRSCDAPCQWVEAEARKKCACSEHAGSSSASSSSS